MQSVLKHCVYLCVPGVGQMAQGRTRLGIGLLVGFTVFVVLPLLGLYLWLAPWIWLVSLIDYLSFRPSTKSSGRSKHRRH